MFWWCLLSEAFDVFFGETISIRSLRIGALLVATAADTISPILSRTSETRGRGNSHAFEYSSINRSRRNKGHCYENFIMKKPAGSDELVEGWHPTRHKISPSRQMGQSSAIPMLTFLSFSNSSLVARQSLCGLPVLMRTGSTEAVVDIMKLQLMSYMFLLFLLAICCCI